MKNFFILFSFLFIFPLNNILAQSLDRVQGELIIQTKPTTSINRLESDFSNLNTSVQLSAIIKNQHIYILSFDYSEIDENKMFDFVQSSDEILSVQFNKLINLRLLPNDPLFENQFQLLNSGQSGGTIDADIDADLAWNITTGGLTANGDTIVVAVLDDGIDLNHQDFGDNLWINYDEIPDNGVDDDDNGYIDDYFGWNSNTDNDNIAGGNHGTPVAGIVGAKGNNGIGVSGVNWDVKVMIIKNDFVSNEANVLAAYGYVLAQRVSYNESNGLEGAFIVSTNASWGIDFGQPSDAPLWCDFYNTLGEAGIVSCGATANLEINVDVEGDLPTACPSDYLISVTNMDDNDQKVNGAGYGLTTIDLGAFGREAYTTSQGNTYGGFGGTSGATPHVAGSIGLLYSIPCANFASLALSDPGAAALLAKNYILDGVDENESLQNITVTGGRLNINNSILLAIQNCSGCPFVNQVEISAPTLEEASISFEQNEDINTVDFRYQEIGATEWITINDISSPVVLTQLTSCTSYRVQFKTNCTDESSDFSGNFIFTTDGCCEAPSNVSISTLDDIYSITWNAITAAQNFTVRIRIQGDENWNESVVDQNIFDVSDLQACTNYELLIITNCEGEMAEGVIVNFLTENCVSCEQESYCVRPEGDATEEHIESISINNIEVITGNNDGSAFILQTPLVLNAAETNIFSLIPGFSGPEFNEGVAVFIDLNFDGELTANERVGQSTEVSVDPVTFPMDLSNATQDGITLMRVMMRYNIIPENPCTNGGSQFGETEDYCIEITNSIITPNCDPITDLNMVSNSLQSITLQWNHIDENASFQVNYGTTQGPPWDFEEEIAQAEQYTFNDLDECEEYLFDIAAMCGNAVSEFVMQSDSTLCEIIDGIGTINSHSIQISPNPFAEYFNIQLFGATSRKANITIYNVHGQQVYFNEVKLIASENLQINPQEELPQGLYFIKIQSEQIDHFSKIMKF